MNVASFYEQVIQSAGQPPDRRHALLSDLHAVLLDKYYDALEAISEEQAAQPVNRGEDRRTLAQVVGHIAEWDRFVILGAGDILAGLKHPRAVTSMEGCVEPDGTLLKVASIDEFNRYQAEKQASWSWVEIRTLAIDTAQVLYTLFSDEWLLNAQRLEQTLPAQKRLGSGVTLENLTMGWSLWLAQLEHLGAEHAAELHLYAYSD